MRKEELDMNLPAHQAGLHTGTGMRGPAEPIAIVGSACRFPGGASSPSKLWDLLRQPRDVLSAISARTDGFNQEAFYHPNGTHHGTSNVKEAYLLDEDPRVFDAGFFSIKPVEAHAMDPQQRILLETVYESLEEAGLSIQGLAGSQTAVYVGQMWADYDVHVLRDMDALPTYTGTGTARSILSNRISHFFDWHGPSVTLDTACSSSLVAVYNAALTLRNGDASVAIVAGANMILTPEPYIGMSNLKMVSAESRSRMWDEKVQGYARGEGVAALVLKKLSDAIRDGDHIDCVIREVGVNQDGRTREGITMPSQHAQRALIEQTYAKAGLDPRKKEDRCQFFEAHGTGTAAGDPREAEAIASAFFGDSCRSPDVDEVLHVGSVKTVIGHTEGTAGIAGIMKASLAMQHGIIPPNLLFDTLNPKVAPFYHNLNIPTSGVPWPDETSGGTAVTVARRRASVNSFGFGGTNAHVILENYTGISPVLPSCPTNTITAYTSPAPFLFSASSLPSLKATVRRYIDYLSLNPATDARNLAYTLSSRRSVLPVRVAFAADTVSALVPKLRQWLEDAGETSGDGHGSANVGRSSSAAGHGILGVFTGQGAQWATMGVGLMAAFPKVRAILDQLDQALQTLSPEDRPSWSIVDELQADATTSRLGRAAIAQPLCTAIQIVLVRLLRAAGISFKAVVGHSSGEIGAAYAAGFLSARDAIRIAYYRGLAVGRESEQGSTARRGAMMAVTTSYEDAKEVCAIESLEGRIQIAAVNSSSSLTLSGDADAIEEAHLIFQDEGKFARLLRVDKAYHSHHMEHYAGPYMSSLRACRIAVEAGSSDTAWFSSVTPNTKMTAVSSLASEYWIDNMVQPVLFSQAVESAWAQQGPFAAVIELGPHPALKGPASQTLSELAGNALKPLYTGLLSRNTADVEALTTGLGTIWKTLGHGAIKFDALDEFVTESAPRQLLKGLPTYSWDHDKAFWHESRQIRARRTRSDRPHDLLGMRTTDGLPSELRWRNLLRLSEIPWVRGHTLQGQIVFPATGYLVTAMEAALSLAGSRELTLLEIRDFKIHRALAIDESRDIETLFVLSVRNDDDQTTLATFKYFACIQRDATEMALIASGSVQSTFAQAELPPHSTDLLPRDRALPNLIDVDPNLFYEFLDDIGYEYSGSFRGMQSIKRKLDYGTGSLAIVEEEWGGPEPIMAPAFLDLSLQTIFVAFGWPRDGSLLDVHVPVQIDSIKVDVCRWLQVSRTQSSVEFVSTLQNTPASLKGDVGIFCPSSNAPLIQMDGISVVPLSPDTDIVSREIYARTTYWPLHMDSAHCFVPQDIPDTEHNWASDLERVSLFYIQKLNREFPPSSRHHLALPHHEFFLEFTNDILSRLESGNLHFADNEWLQDTQEDIDAILKRHPEKVDGQLLRIVGENMGAAMRGETDLLQHMFQGDTMDRWYVESLGFDRLMKWLGEMALHLTNVHPHMNILELGAGTGGATKSIFKHIGDQFASYTFTDISPSFFEQATETFPARGMVFKVLDLEKDIEQQNFKPGSYDLVVASNVLHATRQLDESLRAARRLLKPGGYLLICEITTHDVLRVRLPFSCLAGWWLGREDGRPLSATIDTLEWNTRLLRTGFSGVDAISDESNTLVLASNVILSQAVDDRVRLLREPLMSASPDSMRVKPQTIIIGGLSPSSAALAGQISRILAPRCSSIVRVRCLEDLANVDLPRGCTVLNLGDLDKPALEAPTQATLCGLKNVFEHPRLVLWVTSGFRDAQPFQSMSVGLGRVLMVEMPAGRLQFLDLSDGPKTTSARVICEAHIRWTLLAEVDVDSDTSSLLWSHERELVYDGDVFKVPRIAFDEDMNVRYMASRKMMTRSVSLEDSIVAFQRRGSEWVLSENKPPILAPPPSGRAIQVAVSSAVPCYGGWYLSLGLEREQEQPVMALSTTNASCLKTPVASFKMSSAVIRNGWAFAASVIATELQTACILDQMPFGSSIILWEPSFQLAQTCQRRCHEKMITIVLVTENDHTEDTELHWTVVPRHSRSRHILSRLPDLNATVAVIDCSESSPHAKEPVLDRLLPPASWRVTLCDLARRKAPLAQAPHQLLAEVHSVVAKRADEWTTETTSLAVHSKTCENVDVARDLDTSTSLIIEWEASSSVRATVQPIEEFLSFSPDKTYVLFGLTSDLGQSIAEWLVSRGSRHIVLTSRKPNVDDEWLRLMSTSGVDVRVIASDITREDDVRCTIEEIRRTMPPIGGVANGAMVLMDSPFPDTSIDQITQTLAPKVNGSLHIDSILRDEDLDFFIFFSSIACLSGNRSQGIYSAANMFMTSLAANRRKRGLVASVMHIGAIFGVGYMSRSQNEAMSQNLFSALWKSGVDWLSERDLHNAFAEAVLAGRPELGRPSEFSLGFRRLKMGQDTAIVMSNPRFSQILVDDVTQVSSSQVAVSRAMPAKSRLLEARTPAEVEQIITETVVAKMKSILQLDLEKPENEILASTPEDLGTDSLVTVDLRNWFASELRTDVPVLKLLGGISIAELITFVVDSLSDDMTPNLDPSLAGLPVSPAEPPIDQETVAAAAVSAGAPSVTESLSELVRMSTPLSASWVSVPGPVQSEIRHESQDRTLKAAAASTLSTSPEPSLAEEALSRPSKDNLGTSKLVTRRPEVVRTAPLSLGQARLWFLQHCLADKTALNVAIMVKLRGELDGAAFGTAVEHVANTHEALRTSFSVQDGVPRQSILDKSGLRLETLTAVDETEARAAFNDLKKHDYDLEAGETMKFMFVTLAGTRSVNFLLIGYHHINMDGISLEVFLSDIERSYRGGELPQTVQYPDFSIAQHNELNSGRMSQEKRFWAQEMSDAPQVLPLLPFSDTASRRTLDTYSFVSAMANLNIDTSEAIQLVTKATRTSPFHFFLATYGILLHRLTTADEICIGMAESGREFGKYAHSVGFYLNLLPLRLHIGTAGAARTFEQVLLNVRQKSQKAMAHSRLPFNEILECSGVELADTHSPLFQAFINYRPGVSTKRDYCGCRGEGQDIDASATGYDISLDIVENPGAQVSLRFDLQASLYTQRDAQLLLDGFVGLLQDFASNMRAEIRHPALYGMSEGATQGAVQLGRGPERPCTWAGTLMHRIEMIASHEPHSVALVDDMGSVMTYRAMMKRVHILESGIAAVVQGEKALVGVCCKPSFELICAMLAVLRTGCALVPLDPRIPTQRLASIASSAGIRLLLAHQGTAETSQGLQAAVPGGVSVLDISKPAKPLSSPDPTSAAIRAKSDDIMAVLFTSGSTGTPKGVELTHASLRNTVATMVDSLGTAPATVLQQTAVSFDLHLLEVFVALCSGGKLVIVPQEKRLDPAAVCAMIRDEDVTLTVATPSEYTAWLHHGREELEQSGSWQLAIMAGEMYSLSADQGLRDLGLPSLQLANGFGPTEISIFCTYGIIGHDTASTLRRTGQAPSAGHALANTSIYILDGEGKPVPTGAAGEIFVGGSGVARGYLGDLSLTRAKFMHDPFASGYAVSQGWTRMYGTGDRGKLDEEGTLTVLGRMEGDTQVKIRGVRTELREIEKVIETAADGLVDQIVVSTRGQASDMFLVAHGVLTSAGRAANLDTMETSRQLQNMIQQSALPLWMRPAVMVLVESLPLNLHGKVDRRSIAGLPVEQHLARLQAHDGGFKSLTPPQQDMLDVWRHVLGEGRVPSAGLDPTADFFSMGGTSLQLIQLQSELKRRFKRVVAVAGLFRDSSLAGMAAIAFGDDADADGPRVGRGGISGVDWDQEVLLPPGLELPITASDADSAVSPKHPPQVILLTGATGFVGRALVEALLAEPSVKTIHCLAVRDASRLGALQAHPRLKVHIGDLAHASLSLTRDEQMQLARAADLILHNGADVSFLKSYQSLRAPNVSSTKFLVALAAPRGVPIHYISTTSVGRLLLQATRPLSDTRFPAISLKDAAPGPDWADGYTASKWASEVLLEGAARELRLTTTVHRLSSVTEDRDPTLSASHLLVRDGTTDAIKNRPKTTDIMTSVVDFSLRLGAVPDAVGAGWRGLLDFVSVGRVARGVLSAAFRHETETRTGTVSFEFQSGEELVPVEQIAQYVARRLGVALTRVEVVDIGEWLERARNAGMDELVVAFLHEARKRGDIVFQEVIQPHAR